MSVVREIINFHIKGYGQSSYHQLLFLSWKLMITLKLTLLKLRCTYLFAKPEIYYLLSDD